MIIELSIKTDEGSFVVEADDYEISRVPYQLAFIRGMTVNRVLNIAGKKRWDVRRITPIVFGVCSCIHCERAAFETEHGEFTF